MNYENKDLLNLKRKYTNPTLNISGDFNLPDINWNDPNVTGTILCNNK